ncbi:MAG: glycoprotease family protein [Candidatus Saganbacteria bacterium]|uniref:Glycoprotease family protein n=1 Tax=Candidatus Saganbacteria bacterium TaxID=2575572 RepID=A0A833NZP1_UNCSA|nr:MAG: glycoprotease family protein [Candidatus Saganbacteria bacterium]
MATIGISSADKIISVAVQENEKLLAELSEREALTEDIILFIDKLIKQTKANIDGIAVTIGPGSYSGLRGGVTCAKTLAQTLNIKLAGVSTLHALSYNLRDVDGLIAAVQDGRHNDYNFALFSSHNRKIERITEDLVVQLDKIVEVFSKVKGKIYFTGNTEEIISNIINQNPYSKIQPANNNYASGFNVAIIGEKLIKEGKTSNPLTLAPIYSHKPNIREYQ